ncbi:MAG: hypothetical protein ACLQVY_21520 [Limisphaerales bacterium]
MKSHAQRLPHNFSRSATFASAFIALVLLGGVSCRTAAPLAPADLSAPGWQLRQGQAVWKPSQDRPELAGDLLLAVNTNGDYLVQFTKTPFTLASAEVRGSRWQIAFGPRAWSGRGAPPARFVWFQLAPLIEGKRVADPWQATRHADHSWRLQNSGAGEFLEGQLFQ